MATVLLRRISNCNSKFKNPCTKLLYFSTVVSKTSVIKNLTPNYIFFHESFSDEKEKAQLIHDVKIYEDFVSDTEEDCLFKEVEPLFKRMRYEKGHWDNAITGYRETEKQNWNLDNTAIIEKVKKLAFDSKSVPLKHVHVLDLEEKGVILPHIDSVKFCGSTIAGISLLTNSVMRLMHEKDETKVLDVLLKRKSLYIITGIARYNYKHEILGNDKSVFHDKMVKKSRRISIICRNEP